MTAASARRTRPAAARARPGASVVRSVLMGDPAPVRVSGPRTFVRKCPSTRLPSPSPAAAAACPATTGPPALRHAPRRAEPFGMTDSPVPRDASHHVQVRRAGFPAVRVSAPCGLSCRRWFAPVRALPRTWRTVPCDASTAKCCACSSAHCAAVRRRRHAGLSGPAMSRDGDRLTPGTLAPHHHAGTSFLLTGALAAAGPNPASAPRHYRNSAAA